MENSVSQTISPALLRLCSSGLAGAVESLTKWDACNSLNPAISLFFRHSGAHQALAAHVPIPAVNHNDPIPEWRDYGLLHVKEHGCVNIVQI